MSPPPGYQQPGYPPQGYQPQPGYPPQGGYGAPPPPPMGMAGSGNQPYPVIALSDPLIARDLGSWFTVTFAALKRSWKSLAILQVISLIPTAIFSALTFVLMFVILKQASDGADGANIGGLIGTFVVSAVVIIIVTVTVQAAIAGAAAHILPRDALAEQAGSPVRVGWTDGFRFGLQRLLPMAGWSVATGLLTVLGFLACVLPGMWLGVVFFTTVVGVVAYERASPFGRSFNLIGSKLWSMIGRATLCVLAIQLYQYGTGLVANVFGVSAGFGGAELKAAGAIVGSIVGAALSIPLNMFISVAAVTTYAELRAAQEPLSSAMLAAQSEI
jgi:hypothetical protein